jgi:hypothetical protein
MYVCAADRGNFAGFEWYDFQSCAQCGGIYDERCLRVQQDPIYQPYPQTTCGGEWGDGWLDGPCGRAVLCRAVGCHSAVTLSKQEAGAAWPS